MRGRAVLGLVALLLAGCATSLPGGHGHPLEVVAAESTWGSLVAQLGGDHVHVTSLVRGAGADPHDYEPTAADARRLATADLTVVNGVGYDTWATRLLAANPRSSRVDVVVGKVVGVPDGGNPHRWYSPADVRAVVDAVTRALQRLDPDHAAALGSQRTALLTGRLAPYFAAVAELRTRYAGTPVGASESAFAPLAQALGLRLLTPPAYLAAVSEGTDPTPRDTSTVASQLADHRVVVYVYNTQNATPDVQAQVAAARAHRVPVVAITETPLPAGASFEEWQVGQLTRLGAALAQGTGR
jgi:zinc/manganese transport system substrate-binding protein